MPLGLLVRYLNRFLIKLSQPTHFLLLRIFLRKILSYFDAAYHTACVLRNPGEKEMRYFPRGFRKEVTHFRDELTEHRGKSVRTKGPNIAIVFPLSPCITLPQFFTIFGYAKFFSTTVLFLLAAVRQWTTNHQWHNNPWWFTAPIHFICSGHVHTRYICSPGL